MNILLLLVPLALLLLIVAIVAFAWAVRGGQFEDLETPALSILVDDDPTPDAHSREGGNPGNPSHDD
jgi:cbb3-type cytochrome oxidase maturation protein